MIEVEHNFDPSKFRWLWAKYVTGLNVRYHCTNCITGRYSKQFSKHNPLLRSSGTVSFDEQPAESFKAVYICGVSSLGYQKHRNYPHNIHVAIAPCEGAEDDWSFENWKVRIRNGRQIAIPQTAASLPESCCSLGSEYTTCRIFRWAVTFFKEPPFDVHPGAIPR